MDFPPMTFRALSTRAVLISSALCLSACHGFIEAPHTQENSSNAGQNGDPGVVSSSDPEAVPPGGLPVAGLAPVAGLRRLTSHEYDNTVAALLFSDTRGRDTVLPIDARTPFDNDHTVQVASKALIDGLELIARESVQDLMLDKPRRDAVVGCLPASAEDVQCLRRFITQFGRRALRRPLDADEIERFVTAFMPLAVESTDFYQAVTAALQAFLQHPELVYRIEVGTPVPDRAGLYRLNDFEVATRLSYLLWAAPPDDDLLDLVQAGKLTTAQTIADTARRMLADPKAHDRVQRFFSQWLNYEGMRIADIDLEQAMRAETTALINKVVFQDAQPWQDMFRANQTFVSARLARHYGLPEPANPDGGWVDLGNDQRRGLLGHGTFLSNGAKAGDTSPTMRGIAIRELLMCDEIPAPPPGVNADEPPPADSEGQCKEDRYRIHSQDGCAGCHNAIDPLGFGLERYDQTGRYRTHEADNPECPINGRGKLDAIGSFSGPAELAERLLASGTLNRCLITQYHRFAVGRSRLDPVDEQSVVVLSKRLGPQDENFRFDQLVLDLVTADSFRHRREDTTTP